MEIGLFCGTFNPIHIGHLLIAECARDQFGLSKVLFVTSPTPPHRSTGLLPGEARHRLVEAAITDNPFFEASRLELDRGGTSYTVETVEQVLAAERLKQQVARVNLIIGGDNLPFLKDWHRSSDLLALCRIIVVPRLRYLSEAQADAQLAQVSAKLLDTHSQAEAAQVVKTITQTQPPLEHGHFQIAHQFEVVDFPGIAISSSTIRKRVAHGKTVLYMVPPRVSEIISEEGYYKDLVADELGSI